MVAADYDYDYDYDYAYAYDYDYDYAYDYDYDYDFHCLGSTRRYHIYTDICGSYRGTKGL